nr:hypothetical protein Ade03nite_32180 [Actinoplanes derwentensis]
MKLLYATVNALLSGDTVTTAVPFGQPDPLADTTAISICSGGGGALCKVAAGALRDVSIMAPAVIALNMVCLLKCTDKCMESRR